VTPDEQRQRPSHHIVHDYANLVSSGQMAVSGNHKGQNLLAPLNTHVGHAFYMNCRKMYEFFTYGPSNKFDDMRAAEFTKGPVSYVFTEWNRGIHLHMDKQLMHVSRDRTTRTSIWEGHNENPLFLAEFQAAWKLFIDDLRDECKDEFKEEIRLTVAPSDAEIRLKVASSDFLGLNLYSG
jgi:hypothetical protein